MSNVTNKQQPAVTRVDMSMKIALFIGVMLLIFLFWFSPNLIRLCLYAGRILCLRLFLPRQTGWNIRERQAKQLKQAEQENGGLPVVIEKALGSITLTTP